jgi:adenine-specific DNA-methyltransferase
MLKYEQGIANEMARGKQTKTTTDEARTYKHSEANSPLRPEVGTQSHFPKKKLKAPKNYRYDSSIAPSLEWDDNPAREQTEALIAEILQADSLEKVKAAALKLKAMSQPFLNWTGKAERMSFEVPTLPLFIHERLSTKAIIETVKGHKKGGDQLSLELFGDPQHSIVNQTLKAYEHRDEWVNRMILGDSQVIMNSLLEYEGLGGQVQMIYIDPPYGVKFGSNFQPFVRKRDVKHNEDGDMTREPEMVKAYRDTWEMGLHSYLSYLRDRLVLARELLTQSGSVFVQISDENIHHVRELMDEVFGTENFISLITFQKTSTATSSLIPCVGDYIIWFAKDKNQVKYNQVFFDKKESAGISEYQYIESPDGKERRRITKEEKENLFIIPSKWRLFRQSDVTSQEHSDTRSFNYEFEGETFKPGSNRHWSTSREGLDKLAKLGRLMKRGNSLSFVRYLDDQPVFPVGNFWTDVTFSSRSEDKSYVVQTSVKVIQRCILMTTDPGDLVIDPTCGSGTTAYVAEQWGRRWITCDVSRVPLALSRQRLLTATFPYYELKDDRRGPAGGLVYQRKQNNKGEEIGGIVPHITLKSIANNEKPDEEVLVDRPEILKGITRVTGAFTFEATIPSPVPTDEQNEISQDASSFTDRLLEVLKQTPVLQLQGNRTVKFQSIRKPTKSLNLSAEAIVEKNIKNSSNNTVTDDVEITQSVAFVFGPENGQIVERTIHQAAIEAHAKNYAHLYVIGFAIDPNARELIEHCEDMMSIPATYVQATPDLLMGDLLKNMRSSQIFSVCGLPDISIEAEDDKYRIGLRGLDVFDPITMEPHHRRGDDVPAWFLDTDYNGLCFHVCQAFFPKTAAWDNLKKALKSTHNDSVWEHLAGTISAPFEAGKYRQIAVKVIDDRGNELLVVKELP